MHSSTFFPAAPPRLSPVRAVPPLDGDNCCVWGRAGAATPVPVLGSGPDGVAFNDCGCEMVGWVELEDAEDDDPVPVEGTLPGVAAVPLVPGSADVPDGFGSVGCVELGDAKDDDPVPVEGKVPGAVAVPLVPGSAEVPDGLGSAGCVDGAVVPPVPGEMDVLPALPELAPELLLLPPELLPPPPEPPPPDDCARI